MLDDVLVQEIKATGDADSLALLLSRYERFFPRELRAEVAARTRALQETVESLQANDGLVLNLALAYGGRTEILRAAGHLARQGEQGDQKRGTHKVGLHHRSSCSHTGWASPKMGNRGTMNRFFSFRPEGRGCRP